MIIIVAGDFCPQNRVEEEFEKRQFDSVLGEVKEVISTSDYSIVNFECPVTKGGELPIEKNGPNLQCKEVGVEALNWAGFNCVTLANNHFLDYGKEGVEQTMDSLQRYNIDSVGGGKDLNEASAILYKEFGGQKLAIINCCEHEFSIASSNTPGSNPLNPLRQYYDIREARNHADYVLIIVHGGHEHYQLPSLRMQETYRFFVDAGADAVVNHHQHCYSGFEIYHNKPIFYGLGNFCFDYPFFSKRNPNWAYGYLLELDFSPNDIKYRVIPYEQSAEKASVSFLKNDAFNSKLDELNRIICNRTRLEEEQIIYYKSQFSSCLSVFQPFRSRIAFAARKFKILPSVMSKKWQNALFNMVSCESHKDKILFFLNKYNKDE